ncbi:MAG: anti-sigma factor domain-containing protein [Lachnospiraceae bacterium]|nr:anti-sigma factor domain-containing protein [Lachnospiraceae bacterium]
MKALVLEIRDDKAAILTSEGQIIKVDNKEYRVGQEITFKGPKEKIVEMTGHVKKWGTAIAAALFLLVSASGSYAYLKPYGVVSLDVNPSIEFTINRFDRVLYIDGVNDDGRDILSCIDERKLIHKNIEEALDLTIDTLRAEGYLKEEKDNYVLVAANTDEEGHTDQLVGKLDESISKQDNIEPITMKASDDELLEAREMGTTAGKMKIVDKLNDSAKENIDKDEWINKSVAAIVKESDKKTKEKKAADILVASATDLKTADQQVPTTTAQVTSKSTASSSATSSGSSNNNSNNNTYTYKPSYTASNSGSKSSSKKKTTTGKKGTTTDTKKSSEPAVPDSGIDDSLSSGLVASAQATADATAAAAPAAATPAPTTVPTPAPTATPVPTVIPEIPVIDPSVVIPVIDPAVTQPADPAVQPAEPVVTTPEPVVTEPAPSTPSQPSEPAPSNPEPAPSDPTPAPSVDQSAQQSAAPESGE